MVVTPPSFKLPLQQNWELDAGASPFTLKLQLRYVEQCASVNMQHVRFDRCYNRWPWKTCAESVCSGLEVGEKFSNKQVHTHCQGQTGCIVHCCTMFSLHVNAKPLGCVTTEFGCIVRDCSTRQSFQLQPWKGHVIPSDPGFVNLFVELSSSAR